MAKHKIAVIPGDGIGTEVIDAALKVIGVAQKTTGKFELETETFPWGCDYYLETGKMIDEDGIERLSKFDAIYLGAVGDPRVPDHISLRELLLKIRRSFDQYVNMRPVRYFNGLPRALEGERQDRVNMTFIRENTEGEYAGAGAWLNPNTERETVIQHAVFTRFGTERVIRYAYELARKQGKTLTSITKGNALNYSMVFWDQIFAEVGKDYPEVETQSLMVDAASMYMIRKPEKFQIVVASNLFGDILTDLGAAISGGLGLAAGANLNPEKKFPSMFEPIHGSAPYMTGRLLANPMATIWSGAQMLEHLGYADVSETIVQAIEAVVREGKTLTKDLGGTASTTEVADAVAEQFVALWNKR